MTVEMASQLIRDFESGELPKEEWTHEAHFIMALWYCFHQPLPTAIYSVKEGIKKFNISKGGLNTDSSGYHETITVFYVKMIINYILADAGCCFETKLTGLLQQPFLKKDFLFAYYTRELLMSSRARKNWTAPDIQPFN